MILWMEMATSALSIKRVERLGAGTWIQTAAVVALTAALYVRVIPDLAVEWWTEEASSYGMLVPPMALYIAFQRRQITLSLPAKPDVRGLWLVGLACMVFLAGRLAAEFFLSRISFVLLLAGFAWTFWGVARFRTLLFPFLLLGTMVPLPAIVFTSIAAPLQLFASSIATDLAQLLGVSIYRDGNIIHLATTSLGVAEACSGLNSLSSLVVASLLLGFVENSSFTGRILLFALSVPLAIAVNVMRVTGTALLADYEPALAVGFYHTFSGWLMFVLGFGMLWLSAKLIFRWTAVKV
jgi:exosortase